MPSRLSRGKTKPAAAHANPDRPGGEKSGKSSFSVTVAVRASESKKDAGVGVFRLPSLWSREGLDPAFGEFDGWLLRYVDARGDESGVLIGEGVVLTEVRRLAMKGLIPAD